MVSASSIVLPIAAAWLYMSDDQNYNTIPQQWSSINFTAVDVLNVGPLGVQSDGTFGLYDSTKTGPLSNRFEWVVKTARSHNPNIKIIVSQWWGSGDNIWGDSLSALNGNDAIEKYTDSVQQFVKTWITESGGIDGYDIDYESNNAIATAPTVLSQVRTKLNALSKSEKGRSFYVTASPASLNYLKQAVPSLDFVNMQTYAGGYGLSPQDFLNLNLKSHQLLYGICPESGCQTRSVSDSLQQYKQYNLAGIHLWRLNSNNYEQENQEQEQIYKALHP